MMKMIFTMIHQMNNTSNKLKDGLYRVSTSYLCAGFVIRNGNIIACAPILRRKIGYWKTVATLVV